MATKSTNAKTNTNAASVNPAVFNGLRTPEQNAAVAAARAAKQARIDQPEVVIDPVVTPAIADSAPEESESQVARMQLMVQDAVMKFLGFGDDNPDAPTWKRKMAAFFSSIVLSAGAGTAIGWLAGHAMVGIAVMGGSVLWSYLVMVIAMIGSVYAGAKIAQYVGNYVLSGQVDKDIVAVKDTVLGWFTSAKDAITAKTVALRA